MENDNTVLLNPPLFALDKDAPLHYAGNINGEDEGWGRESESGEKTISYRTLHTISLNIFAVTISNHIPQ